MLLASSMQVGATLSLNEQLTNANTKMHSDACSFVSGTLQMSVLCG